MEREREMAERLLDMEQKLDGFVAEPGAVSQIEKWLTKYAGDDISLGALVLTDIQIIKGIGQPTRVRIEAADPSVTFSVRPSTAQAMDSLRRFMSNDMTFSPTPATFTRSPDDLDKED